MPKELTTQEYLDPKIEKFCHEYLKDFNATRAYQSLYPDKRIKYPRPSASKFMDRPAVQKRLAEIVRQASEKEEDRLETVLDELMAIAMFNTSDFMKVEQEVGLEVVDGKVVQTRNGALVPKLDLDKLLRSPRALRATTLKFNRVIDKDGGSHDVYELKAHDKIAALTTLLRYYQIQHNGGVDAPGEGEKGIHIHVNFPTPGSEWQQPPAGQPAEYIDAEPVESEE